MATPWSVMNNEDRIKAIIGAVVILLLAVFLIAGLLAGAQSEREKKAQSLELQQAVAANDPVRFAKALVPGAEAAFEGNRNPQTGLIDRFSTLTVTYSLDPVPDRNWLARNAFFRRVSEIVPAVFERFDHIEVVAVKGTAMMVDVRGHERLDEVASVTFARSNSRGVNWPNVKPENVPRLANKHYLHPRLVSDLAASDPVRATSRKDRPRRDRISAPRPEAAAAGELGGAVDKLADRLNATSKRTGISFSMALQSCERGTTWTCQYRIGNFITAYARSTDEPPALAELLMQYTVDRTMAAEGAMELLYAIAVVLKELSPTATKEENSRVLQAVAEATSNPDQQRSATAGRVQYVVKLDPGNGLWISATSLRR